MLPDPIDNNAKTLIKLGKYLVYIRNNFALSSGYLGLA